MIAPRTVAENMPFIKPPMELFEMIHNVSVYLVTDDKHDIGRGQYYSRSDYYYHGKHSPDHPSPLHHWILGYFGIITSQIGSALVKAFEMFEDYQKLEAGDLSEVDDKIIDLVEDDNTISLGDYVDEVASLPIVSQNKDGSSPHYRNPEMSTPQTSASVSPLPIKHSLNKRQARKQSSEIPPIPIPVSLPGY